MNRTIAAFLLSTSMAGADFANDQYLATPDALVRITAAMEGKDSPLRSSADDLTSYALRRAEYLGPCAAPFGTIHIARLFYVRSAPRGSQLPARGHTFIAFLDADFKFRSYWPVSHALGQLSARGSKLLLDGKELCDFAHPPALSYIMVDETVQPVPKWELKK